MASSENANTVRAVYDALNANDMDRLASYTTPDAQVTSVPFEAKATFRDDWGPGHRRSLTRG